jgi:hypothetical protein
MRADAGQPELGGCGTGDAGQPGLRDFSIRFEFIVQKCHEGIDGHYLRFPATSRSGPEI